MKILSKVWAKWFLLIIQLTTGHLQIALWLLKKLLFPMEMVISIKDKSKQIKRTVKENIGETFPRHQIKNNLTKTRLRLTMRVAFKEMSAQAKANLK
jgi:hypothetical protein